MGNRAFIFPGQGVQRVGMGADVAEHSAAAKRVYSTADAILGMELTALSFEGPADTLTETCNAQPAIFTASAACLAAYLEACGAETVSGLPDALQPALVAGHSIGELTALYAAEALALEDGLRLVQARGELMQRAVADTPRGNGGGHWRLAASGHAALRAGTKHGFGQRRKYRYFQYAPAGSYRR